MARDETVLPAAGLQRLAPIVVGMGSQGHYFQLPMGWV